MLSDLLKDISSFIRRMPKAILVTTAGVRTGFGQSNYIIAFNAAQPGQPLMYTYIIDSGSGSGTDM
jgi:hypothetical protein